MEKVAELKLDGKTAQLPVVEGSEKELAIDISALRENRAPALNAQDGIQATRIVLAADSAIRTGKVQSIV